MAQKFTVPITIKQLASAGSDALTVFIDGETSGRVKLEGGGRISWGNGSDSHDTNLYRDSANILATDDVFKALAGIVTKTNNGIPTVALPDGALAIDTTNDSLYFRSNGQWVEVSAGGLLSGDVDGGILSPEIHEAEVTNYVMVGFDGGTL